MKRLLVAASLIAGALLFIGLMDLPIGYYTFLRIVVFLAALLCIYVEYEVQRGFSFWMILFGLIAILFNPIIKVYLGTSEAWAPIDVIAGILFVVYPLVRYKSIRE